MKRKTLPLLALVASTLFLSACDDRSDDLKAISKFKDLTPPRFSDVVSRQDDGKRAARTVLTGMCYSFGNATRQGSSSLTRFIGQSAITSSTWRR